MQRLGLVFVSRTSAGRPARRWSCLVLVASCTLVTCNGPTRPSPSARSLSIGQWGGTTSQGMPIAFSVSSDEKVTTITIGYSFNGCTGSETFSGLDVPTAPDIICIPGPCSGAISSYRALHFSSSGPIDGPRTAVNGLFVSAQRAEGQAGFFNYPGCGSASGVGWTATRR
jgi:hypothetical protein